MSRAFADPGRLMRLTLAAIVVVDLVSLFHFIGDALASVMSNGIPVAAVTAVVSSTPVRAGIVIAGVVGAIAFGRRPGNLWGGLLSLAALALLSTTHAALFGSPWRHLFYSGLCLSGWLIGLAVGRLGPIGEAYARTAAIALLGAAYMNAGISKVVFGGVHWLSSATMQAVIIGQSGLIGSGAIGLYRSWVVETPWVASCFSIVTVLLELAGPLMIFGRGPRIVVASGLLAMHANIYLLTSEILYWEAMVFLVVFGFASEPEDDVARQVGNDNATSRSFIWAASALSACAVFAISHQAHRYARNRPLAPPGAEEVRPTASVAQLGPFAVGQELPGAWSITAFELSDQGIRVLASSEHGKVAFELTCSSSPNTSPFDVGAVHIFYSSEVEPGLFRAAGEALREQIRNAADTGAICARLAEWRHRLEG